MKKVLNLLLAFGFLFYSMAPACLALDSTLSQENSLEPIVISEEQEQDVVLEGDTQAVISTDEIKSEDTNSNTAQVYQLENYVPTGNLEVDVKFALPISNIENPNMGVIIRDESGHHQEISLNGVTTMESLHYSLGSQTGELSIRKMDQRGILMNGSGNEKIKYYAITIYHLQKGKYTVEFYGDGYKTYAVENITLDDYAKRVSFSNEKGMFEVGDVNDDNAVDEKDLDALMKTIESGKETSYFYDLNRDGSVDIVDLAMLASLLNGQEQEATVVDTAAIIDSRNMEVEGIIDGNIDDLFQEGGTVSVIPENPEEAISETNPAVLSMNLEKPVEMKEIRVETGLDNALEDLVVEVETEDGKTITKKVSNQTLESVHAFTDKASADTIVIDLGDQVAVKRVTIRVTKTKNGSSLADITEVAFLNNVYDEVPQPKIELVKNVKVEVGSESVTITWDNMSNVTGYELYVEELEETTNKDGEVEYTAISNETYQTTYNTFEIQDLKNYTKYRVQIRGTNGDWRGNYNDPVIFSPEPKRLPPKPDMVNLTPAASGIDVSFKKMDDTISYKIYYRKQGESEEKVVTTTTNSYKLRGLETGVVYEVYVRGVNHLGEGEPSVLATASPLVNDLPDVTNHSLINTSNGAGIVSNHISHVKYSSNAHNASEFALVDNDKETYWQFDSWDAGGFNPGTNGPTFIFDNEYKIDHIFIVPTYDTAGITYASLIYDDHGVSKKIGGSYSLTARKLTSPNGQVYFRIDFEPITTSQIQVNLANGVASGNISIREVKFYQYHPLEDEVGQLFKDDLRVELNDWVTEKEIAALEEKANEKDQASGEYHPNRTSILNDLTYARQLLNDTAVQDVIIVDQSISTAKNGHLGFSSLSDLQPLGIVARPGEQITVYVGTTGNVMPQLVFTQYYAEAGTWKQSVTNLKKGRNVIDVPKIGNMATERGGSVYVRYPSATEKGELKVRVSGGTKIPVLDIHRLTDEQEIKKEIQTYIKSLASYVEQLPTVYQSEGKSFDKYTSVLNSTEIVTKNGLFSVAATAAYDGIQVNCTADEQVTRLYDSLVAFEEMMGLFYRHKGLSETPAESKDQTPASRINIRLMRMFDGAFMYASGDHIGIEYGSINGLMQGKPNQVKNGQMTTTGYFGWGISHEIGHQINQGNLAHAEVTNNVFALLAQTSDDVSTARIEDRFEKIYQKVTSGTIGKGSDVFVTLAMYWQLHLAYDENRTFSDTDSIFARINKISRRSTLKDFNKDELLVIFASQAANKNLITFFEKWGIVIGEDARHYIRDLQLEEETRPIWYLNVESRRYRLAEKPAMKNTTVKATFDTKDAQNKRYTLQFEVTGDKDAIMGYEIKRNGVPIMFTTEDSFTDVIGSLNNQALTYEVTAYDYYLNATNTYTLEEVKVSHDGSISKDNFDIRSNFKAESEKVDYEDPDMDMKSLQVNHLIDGDDKTSFSGVKRIEKDSESPYVILDLNAKMDISGIKYQAIAEDGNSIQNYEVYVSKDNENWILAKKGTFSLTKDNQYTNLIYFDKEGTTGGNQLYTYSDISYIKIVAIDNKGISGVEIDVIAPPGDNVEISNDTIGILKEDYHYTVDGEGDAVIPAGSVVFKGDYRGNPAFNVVLLVDSKDSSIRFDGMNFLFASLDSNAEVDEIAHGTWLYTVTEEQYEEMRKANGIRAELYRVDDALTNDGDRLTSTSLAISDLPAYDSLKPLEIKGN